MKVLPFGHETNASAVISNIQQASLSSMHLFHVHKTKILIERLLYGSPKGILGSVITVLKGLPKNNFEHFHA
jgi:hypothetical protein